MTTVRKPIDLIACNVGVSEVETTLLRYLHALPGFLLSDCYNDEMMGQSSVQKLPAYLDWYRKAMPSRSTLIPSIECVILQLMDLLDHMLHIWNIPLSHIVERYYGVFFTPPFDESEEDRKRQRRALGFWIQWHCVLLETVESDAQYEVGRVEGDLGEALPAD